MGKPVREHQFHPKRKWRFDFAYPDLMIAIEIEGGIWTQGRHITPQGFMRDIEKYNAAAELGWRVFRIPAHEIHKIKYYEQISRCANH